PGPQGNPGPQGEPGPVGPQGPPGPQGEASSPPLTASVSPQPNYVISQGSSGYVGAEKVATGVYRLTFSRDVSLCVRVASLGVPIWGGMDDSMMYNPNNFKTGFVSTSNVHGDPTQIWVLTKDAAGDWADRDFNVVVSCE